jgi:minor histocompatibility antigen H13
MITVAKTIDAPIKLVFTSATGASMLGLGDIVVPGMMMALALRFDSYQHYQRKVKLEPIELATTTAATPTDTSDTSSDETQEATTTTTTTSHRRIKATYTDTLGQWGNRLWTSPCGRLPADDAEAADAISATAFPKPYFHASVAGYTAGMVVTLVVMLVSGHGQPALLYLVPGVTGSLWLTGLVRREVGDMWVYTEDGSLDTEEVVVEVDGEGKVVEENEVEEEEEEEDGEEEESGSEEKRDQKKKKKAEEEKKKLLGEEKGKASADKLNLFMLSVTAPRAAAAIS